MRDGDVYEITGVAGERVYTLNNIPLDENGEALAEYASSVQFRISSEDGTAYLITEDTDGSEIQKELKENELVLHLPEIIIETTTTTTTTTPPTTTTTTTTTEATTTTTQSGISGYAYIVATKEVKFYFSHDEAEFTAEDLIASITRYAVDTDGAVSENGETLKNFDNVSFGSISPSKIYADKEFEYMVTVSITDEFGTQNIGECRVLIGVKGDANLDGSADAIDAAAILSYAAAVGAGQEAYLYSETDETVEGFAFWLANVNGVGSADATDAAATLVYAAAIGSGEAKSWEEILGAT